MIDMILEIFDQLTDEDKLLFLEYLKEKNHATEENEIQ